MKPKLRPNPSRPRSNRPAPHAPPPRDDLFETGEPEPFIDDDADNVLRWLVRRVERGETIAARAF